MKLHDVTQLLPQDPVHYHYCFLFLIDTVDAYCEAHHKTPRGTEMYTLQAFRE